MPILDSQIEVFRLCVRINRLRYQIVRDYRMTPNLAGLSTALATLKHSLEGQAAQLLDRANAVNARTSAALAKANVQMAATEQAAADIEAFANSLEGSNGGPTLSDSSGTSAQSPVVAPEKLDVHGVSL
jgi:hypothetical protein